jgi:hypothetical protein
VQALERREHQAFGRHARWIERLDRRFVAEHAVVAVARRGESPASTLYPLLVLVGGTLIVFAGPTTRRLAERLTWLRLLFAVAVLLLAISQLLCRGFQPFVYFRF